MIYELLPWRTLTRLAVPPLRVTRRDLTVGEVTFPVGATIDPEVFPLQIRKERLRQFYEQRRLEPVNAPPDSRQFYREQRARLQEAVIEPIQPVASQIVADLPSTPVAPVKNPPKKGAR